MFIRNFGDDRTYLCFEGGSAELPFNVRGLARTFMHVLDSQGLAAVLLSYGASVTLAQGAYDVRIAVGVSICFRWADGDAHDVRIEDYHRG